MDKKALPHMLERALAFAHRALEEPTPDHVRYAQRYAAWLMPQLERPWRLALTLSEASHVVALVKQLHAVLQAVDRHADPALAS
jgi:hypothetical protein